MRTKVWSSATASTKTTREPDADSWKAPGDTCPASRCELKAPRYSALFESAQGEANSDKAEMAIKSGARKTSTGRIQASSETPDENHTTISESR